MNHKDNILVYAFIGIGYLLFCSAIPSMIAIQCSAMTGGDINGFYLFLSFVTGIIYIIIIFSIMKERVDLFAGFSLKGILEAIVTALLLFFVINFVVSPALSILFPTSAGNYDVSMTDMMSTPIATFFQVAVVAPLFEELIFRGLIMKRALRKWSAPAAVVMTAFLFGLLHLSIVQGLSAAAAGILLCTFYERRRSVGLNILAHGIYNSMVFGLAMLIY